MSAGLQIILPLFTLFLFLNQTLNNAYDRNFIENREAFPYRNPAPELINDFPLGCAWPNVTIDTLKKNCGKRWDSKTYSSSPFFNKTQEVTGTARPGEWPWMAVLEIHESSIKMFNISYCSGVLIGDAVVIAPPHCIPKSNESYIIVQIGGRFLDHIEDREQIVHGIKTKIVTTTNSFPKTVGIVWLDRKIKFNCYITPVCVAKKTMVINNSQAWVVGYATVLEGDDILRQKKIANISNTTSRAAVNKIENEEGRRMKYKDCKDFEGVVMVLKGKQWYMRGFKTFKCKNK